MKITPLRSIVCFNDGRCIKTECRLLESICKRSYRHKTVPGIFLQGCEKNAIDACGKGRVEGTHRLRWNMKVLIHHLLLTSHKSGAPREQIIGQHCKSILIASGDRFPTPDLRRHTWRCGMNAGAVAGC